MSEPLSSLSDRLPQGPFNLLDPDVSIRSSRQDRLGIGPFIQRLVRPLLLVPRESSLVLGLYGPWGAGKSSALALLEERLRDASNSITATDSPESIGDADVSHTNLANTPMYLPLAHVVRFTPWLYADVEALLASFFETLGTSVGGQAQNASARAKSAAILKGLGEITKPALKVAAAFIPIPGFSMLSDVAIDHLSNVISSGAKTTASVLEGGEITFRQRKEAADRVLQDLQVDGRPARLVVLIDDLDRAGPNEILAMLRVVKLVADLPNVSYVIAMDYERVASTLDQLLRPLRGAEYLEKIVQIGVDLPPLKPDQLSRFLVDEARQVFERAGWDASPLNIDWGAWSVIRDQSYELHVRRALKTPRDVVRVLNRLRFMLLASDAIADVPPVDALLISVLQVVYPHIYRRLYSKRSFLLHDPDFDPLSVLDREGATAKRQEYRRRSLEEIVAESSVSNAQIADPLKDLHSETAMGVVERGKYSVPVEILLELFPFCLQDGQISDEDAAKARGGARICAKTHFDHYFRFLQSEEQIPAADVKVVIALLSKEHFDDKAATEFASQVARTTDDRSASLNQSLADYIRDAEFEQVTSIGSSAVHLATSVDLASSRVHDLATNIAIAVAQRLRVLRSESQVGARDTSLLALNLILRIIDAQPADNGAELAEFVSRDSERKFRWEAEERLEISRKGLSLSLQALRDSLDTIASEPSIRFANRVWRARRLAEDSGVQSAGSNFPELAAILSDLIANAPMRIGDVVCLAANWSARDDDSQPFFEAPSRIKSTLNAYIDANVALALAQEMSKDGTLLTARWGSKVQALLMIAD